MATIDQSQPDVLSQLQASSWRGIGFPSLMFDTEGGHATVPHKRVDRNTWRVENLGLNSYVFHFKAPFINTIARAPGETWSAGALYPDVYQRMIAALEDRSTGDFVHPIYGSRRCKVGPFKDTIDADFRGGPTLVVTLIETLDDNAAVAQSSDVSIAQAAAFSLDATIPTLIPPPSTGAPFGQSLTDFIKSLGSVADQADLFKQQVAGKIQSVISAMTNVAAKYGDTPELSDNTQRLISSLHSIQATTLVQDKAIALYLVKAPSMLASIANRTKSTVKDLLVLNPDLAALIVIPANTVVRTYA